MFRVLSTSILTLHRELPKVSKSLSTVSHFFNLICIASRQLASYGKKTVIENKNICFFLRNRGRDKESKREKQKRRDVHL